MKSRPSYHKRLAQKIEDLRNGVEPKVTKEDLMGEVGRVPPPEVRAVLQLAQAIHDQESAACSVSWTAQQKAMDFFNAHGLAATLDKLFNFITQAPIDCKGVKMSEQWNRDQAEGERALRKLKAQDDAATERLRYWSPVVVAAYAFVQGTGSADAIAAAFQDIPLKHIPAHGK